MAKRTGRPTKFTNKLAADICAEISSGRSLRTVCNDPKMPDKATVFRWLARTDLKSFRDQYELALQSRADMFGEDILDIADDGSNDYLEMLDKDGEVLGYRANGEVVQRSRLRVDTRKWLMARMNPKKYGERLDVTSGDKPLERTVAVFDMRTGKPRKPAKPKDA